MKTPTFRITLIVAALAVFWPVLLSADGMDHDRLLAPDGTLYTVESVAPEALPDGKAAASMHALILTVQKGDKSTTLPIPASLTDGYHFAPALAYDSATKTLFIFWERLRNGGFSSDLTFCSYRSGQWGTAATLDTFAYDLRENLRIAVTTRTEQRNAAGEVSWIPEVTVHAIWWQLSGSSEWARYAMLPTDGGNVRTDVIQVRNLTEFVTDPAAVRDTLSDNEILRHPLAIESAAHDTVDFVFGDLSRDTMHRVTIKPVANGRLRIPIGVKEGGLPTPQRAASDATAIVSGVSAADGSLAYYFESPNALKYVLYKGGQWSPLRSLALNEKLSAEGAVSAIRRMMESE